MPVKLASINIFSFNDKNKVKFIKDFLDNHCIDICFIQETHVKDTQNMQIINDFINIYTPNSSENQCEFVNDLHAIIGSKKNIILGGDFNYIEDRDHDKKNTKKWNNLYKNFNLCEFEWNIPSINIKDAYTWSKGNFKSRIDRFYCENPFKICVNILTFAKQA
jgi:exonuclease III